MSVFEVRISVYSLSPFKDHEFSPPRSEAETVGHLPRRGRFGLRRGGQVNPARSSTAESLSDSVIPKSRSHTGALPLNCKLFSRWLFFQRVVLPAFS